MRLQSIISKENFYYTAASIGAGLIAAHYLKLPSKAVATVSLIIGGVTSIGRGFLDANSTKTKLGLAGVCSLAASFFAAALLLNTCSPAILSAEIVAVILGSNFVGQALTAVLLKTVLFNPFSSLKTLLSVSDSKLDSLYEKYENDKEAYQNLSPLIQLLLYNEVFSIGKKFSTLPALPTEEEILALTDEEVRELHDSGNFIFTENCPAARRLLLRYFELNLPYDTTFDSFMKELPLSLPSTSSKLRQFSLTQIKWLKAYFQVHPTPAKLDINVQWGLYKLGILPCCVLKENSIPMAHPCIIREIHQDDASDVESWIAFRFTNQQALKLCFQELKLQHSFPCHPQTAKDVENLSDEWVQHYHQFFDPSFLTEDAQRALIARFFKCNLPPPQTAGDQPWTSSQLDLYSQLDFSFSMQALIFKECFNSQTNFEITFSLPTDDEISSLKVPKKMAQLLHQQFKTNTAHWKSLSAVAQWDLNQKVFHKNSCPSLPLTLDPKKLPTRASINTTEWYLLFQSNPDLWNQLTYSQQYDYNQEFSERWEIEIPETHLPPYRIC